MPIDHVDAVFLPYMYILLILKRSSTIDLAMKACSREINNNSYAIIQKWTTATAYDTCTAFPSEDAHLT